MDLNVLVVTDGSAWVEGIRSQLASEGLAATVLSTSDAHRPQITDTYLADQVGGAPRAKFQAVVLANENPGGLSSAELTALTAYEQQYGIRQVNGFSYPSANVGLNSPIYSGKLDGTTAHLTAAATGDAFRYLAGPVPLEDNDPAVTEAYGYLATPQPDNTTTGAHFEPLLTATVPGGTAQGTLMGVYRKGGREQLVTTFAYNGYQQQFRLLAHGIIDWATRGVHLGYYRNYFTVNVDDIYAADDRWNSTAHCTPGNNDCPPGTPDTVPVRITPQDVDHAVAWQQQHNFQFDFMYNGVGSDEVIADHGSDPLTTSLDAQKSQFRWVNHTYSHGFLGCQQDFTVIPWRCVTNAAGQVQYVSQADINIEITKNLEFAQKHGLPIQADELLSGEHSGTFILPQQPQDNPNFLAALSANDIAWVGLDASRETGQRQVASALGVPRHPMNVFYNVANPSEEVSEYNWIYTSRANGGSGVCEDNPATTTCITPLDPNTGYANYIVPLEVKIAMRHVTSNDPQPHYVHQSNLAEGRLLYPVVEGVLATYRAQFAANTPIVNPRLSAAGQTLQRQAAWTKALAAGGVTAYSQGGTVTVQGSDGVEIPVTVPEGTTVNGAAFGESYAGQRSAYLSSARATLTLPAGTLPLAPRALLPVVLDQPVRPAIPVTLSTPKLNTASDAVLTSAAAQRGQGR
ncbi:hypothetical protein GCM10010174_59490 [Kutzneria viridogrisea]|uniref:Uncharacterized protein n=1 Tax=Kutzneria viridogrisea TaxID=47990 RepID=A0ABR6BJY6_9PSEU|nr:hypothetical protein [Kutzneria viridogrisea]